MKKKSLVLLSAGLDSLTNFVIARKKTKIVLALTFDYGQQSRLKEIKSAQKICRKYKIPHKIIALPWLKKITNKAQVWVPNRNGVFLNVAASFAESLKIDYIIVGFNAEEAITFPDNSLSFLKIANKFFSFSTLTKAKVHAYTGKLNKNQIVKKALQYKIPWQFLWSCYTSKQKHCWRCQSCLRLKRALEYNNFFDNFKEFSK